MSMSGFSPVSKYLPRSTSHFKLRHHAHVRKEAQSKQERPARLGAAVGGEGLAGRRWGGFDAVEGIYALEMMEGVNAV